jgi:hypothetical protein
VWCVIVQSHVAEAKAQTKKVVAESWLDGENSRKEFLATLSGNVTLGGNEIVILASPWMKVTRGIAESNALPAGRDRGSMVQEFLYVNLKNRNRFITPSGPVCVDGNLKFLSPGVAARIVKIARCTAYGWRKEDEAFAAAWADAVETGLDVLETSVYDSALAGNSSDAQFILKHRRRDVYGNVDNSQAKSNFSLNITLQEHYKQLERLGLPIPLIESDREEDDAPDPAATDHP